MAAQFEKLTIRIKPELDFKIAEIAKARGVSKSQIVSEAIKWAIEGSECNVSKH